MRIRTQVRLGLLVAGLVSGLSGCGSSAPAPTTADLLKTASESPARATMGPSERGNAASAVEKTLKAFRNGQLEEVYDFLPLSYQADIDSLVQTFVKRMDPEVWSQTYAVLGKGAEVLDQKQDLFLAMAQKPGNEAELQNLSAEWGRMAAVLKPFVNGDLAQLEFLKTIPSRELIQRHATPVAKQLLASSAALGATGNLSLRDLEQTKVELVSEAEYTAVVRITTPSRVEPETVDFLLIESRWIPESLANSWPETIRAARASLEELTPESIAQWKPQYLQLLKTVDAAFAKMLEAKRPEDLQAAAAPIMFQAMLMSSLVQESAKPKPMSAPAEGIMLTIGRELSDDEQTKLLTRLEAFSDDPAASSYTATATGGKTLMSIKPVKNVTAFAEKLTFLREPEIDVESRTITAADVTLD